MYECLITLFKLKYVGDVQVANYVRANVTCKDKNKKFLQF